MENYIDALSPAEYEAYYGYTPSAQELQADREHCAQDLDYNYQHLFLLFLDRGQPKAAQAYFDKIQDPQRRLDAQMLAYECAD